MLTKALIAPLLARSVTCFSLRPASTGLGVAGINPLSYSGRDSYQPTGFRSSSSKLHMSSTASKHDKDICDILTEDHNAAKELLKHAENAAEDQSRRDYADKAIAALVRHSVAEEMFVYPLIRDNLGQGRDDFDNDLDEHQKLEEAMSNLEKADTSSPDFKKCLDEVKQLLDKHTAAEENEQFPALRKEVDRQKLVDVIPAVENVKKLAPTHPHPNTPSGPTARAVLGPAAGLADKLRDTLTGRAT